MLGPELTQHSQFLISHCFGEFELVQLHTTQQLVHGNVRQTNKLYVIRIVTTVGSEQGDTTILF